MSLNMVCLDLDARSLALWGHRRYRHSDTGYLVHAASRQIFGALGPQPFFTELERGRVLGYTAAGEEQLRACLAAAAGDALLGAVFSLPDVCLRPMPETWQTGARYRFSVFCRPTVRHTYDQDGPATETIKVESDVWLRKTYNDWKAAGKPGTLHNYRQQHKHGIEETYLDWLKNRLFPAARLESAIVAGSRSAFMYARGGKDHDGPPSRSEKRSWPETTFTGTLTVADPAAFDRLIRHGVGRHAAFGFGMLLLRAAD